MSPTIEEPIVHPSTPVPAGYTFIRKGNVYITKNCRKLTHEACQTVYVVQEHSRGKKKGLVLGIRVPTRIWHVVRQLNAETKEDRADAVRRKDEKVEEVVRTEIERAFPKVPSQEVGEIVRHTLVKRSGRVGRVVGKGGGNGDDGLGLEKVVELAVRAHVRHKCTGYDGLLRRGVAREDARKQVKGDIEDVVQKWGGRVWEGSPEAREKKRKTHARKTRPSARNGGKKSSCRSMKAGKRQNALPRRRSLRLEQMQRSDGDEVVIIEID